MNDTANLISVSQWTAEDHAIINRPRRLPNRADEAFGDKCDALRMLMLARQRAADPIDDSFFGAMQRENQRHARAFGGLSPSEISDTSALDAAHERSELNAGNRDVPSSQRVHRCQVVLTGWNPPVGHQLLPEFICDVRTRQGAWAWFCPACAAAFGVGFGLGKGQRFVNDKTMRKVEG